MSPADGGIECTRCGACCVAPDIAALDKALGVRCPHLGADDLCAVYQDRPQVCRDYAADELCRRVAAPTMEERVARYLEVFDLADEAARVRAAGHGSMGEARRPLRLAVIARSAAAGPPRPSR